MQNADQTRRSQQSQIQAQVANRQSRGICRETFNAAVNKIPGIYNEHCEVEIEPLEGSIVAEYDQDFVGKLA